MKEGLKFVNVSAEDIQAGNRRIILGLIWTIILRYQINKRSENVSAHPCRASPSGVSLCSRAGACVSCCNSTPVQHDHIQVDNASGAKNALLEWVRSRIPEYNIKNFTTDWNDGRAICALVNSLREGQIPNHWSMDPSNALDNAKRG